MPTKSVKPGHRSPSRSTIIGRSIRMPVGSRPAREGRRTTRPKMRVQTYCDFASLPPRYGPLFERAGIRDFCLTRAWFETFALDAMDRSERLCLIGIEDDGPESSPLALVVTRHRERDGGAGGARTLSSLSNYYSMVFQPLVAEQVAPAAVLAALFKAVCAQVPRYDRLGFQPLDRDSPLFGELREALRQAGLVVEPYFHFGNWYEQTDGLSFRHYLERRPSPLRNTLRRKGRALDRAARARFELIAGGPALERGIADYERVYAMSWKRSEPYPRFIGDLMRTCARMGALRLGLIHLDGSPAAAQIWIVWQARATLYKLAHDRRFDQLSVGSLLTGHMIERMIDVDRVAEVDFGAGDDRFKRAWTSRRRERWGLVAFNPRTVRGALGALRHVVGARVKRAIVWSASVPKSC